MTPLSIKVCGMIEAENIREVEQPDVDIIGFISYPKSLRCLCGLSDYLPVHVKRVGVFVNENKESILMYANRLALDYIQLHDDESLEYCQSLCNNGLHLIKAFSTSHLKDLMCTLAYKGLRDYYLLDIKTPQYGGSGNQFDWNPLYRYGGMTFSLLNGRINPYSIKTIKESHHPKLAGIDINSRFETVPGQKDMECIKGFLREIRNSETTNK